MSDGPAFRPVAALTQPPLLTWFAVLQVVLFAVVVFQHLLAVAPEQGAQSPGDYMAFHTAARMLVDERGPELYSLTAQAEQQRGLLGRPVVGLQPYAYPPLMAAALMPLARLPLRTAYLAHACIMAAALVLAVLGLLALAPNLARTPLQRWTLALLVVGFHPLVRTTFAGQNTALSLALVTGTVLALHKQRPMLAGMCLGLLTFKPQLLPVPLLALALTGQMRALTGFSFVALGHVVIGMWLVVTDWPLRWLAFVGEYQALEAAANTYTHLGVWALAAQVLSGSAAPLLGALACGGLLWATLRAVRAAQADEARTHGVWALVVTAALLTSPHLQYYDFGLVCLPVVMSLERLAAGGGSVSHRLRLGLLAGYLGYPAYRFGPALGVQPLALCLLGVAALAWHAHATPKRTSPA